MIKRSGLRGRGGAGFPAAKKWELARNGCRHPQVPDLQRR